MAKHIILGVDIGGSHITSALVNVKDGTILTGSLQREKIDAMADAGHIISAWCKVMDKSLQSADNGSKIAIAMPGPFDYQNGISYMRNMGKYDALYGMDIRKLILSELKHEVNELHFINDAGCFLQGEISHGPAASYDAVAGFTLGTGFGSAFALAGIATDGDYWCHPFMGGICEDFFSSRWFVSKYNEYAASKVKNVKELIDNIDFGAPMLQVFDEFSINLSAFLTQLYKKRKFDCVVLGGNIAKAEQLFLPQLKYHVRSMGIDVPIFISSKGEDAALIGAACSI